MTMKKTVQALTTIPSLVAAGTGVLAALALHSWLLAALGIAASGALAAVEATKRPRLRAPSDPHTAAAARAIAHARAELDAVLAEEDASVSSLLAPIADLDAHAARLVRRADEIAAHLAKANVPALQREIAELGARAAQASDDATRTHYGAARAARIAHLETIAELVRTKERIGATLLSIAATLDALPAKVVRLRGLEGTERTRDVGRDLAAMNEQIASFEETLLSIHGA